MSATKIFEYFQNRQASLLSSIREIVEIESPSFNAEKSTEVVRWIEKELLKIPLEFSIEKIIAEGYGCQNFFGG
jgi:acetylornithine deacetylase/succinyl-diaminopimelate desuccinylase-like protein